MTVDHELDPEQISVDGKTLNLQDYVQEHEQLEEENARLEKEKKKGHQALPA